MLLTPLALSLVLGLGLPACGDKGTGSPDDSGTTDGGGGGGDDSGDGGGPVVDNDEDGSPYGEDCDDTDPDVHPGAEEICNGKDDDCDPSTDEATWITTGDQNYDSLQAAIDAAAEGEPVKVCSGIFHEHLVISRSVTVLSTLGAELTAIDGSTQAGSAVEILGGDVTLSGFTIMGGTGSDHRGDGDSQGGGVYVGNPTHTLLSQCVFSGNSADRGGALFVDSGCSVEVQYGTFQGNTAATGGAVSGVEATVALGSCDISGNSATTAGGALAGTEVAFQVNSGSVKANTAPMGGGATVVDDTSLHVIGSDWGDKGADDNDPDDVWTPKRPYNAYGAASSFSCTPAGCD